MTYVPPHNVISPKRVWHLFEVLIEGEAGHGAFALGTWDGERRLAFRWNGTEDNPIGNPQSRGLPTWTMLDKSLHDSVVDMLPDDKKAVTCSYLGLKGPVELKVSYHPSGRYTLMKKEVGHGMFTDMRGDLFVNDDKGKFYTAVSKTISDLMKDGRHVSFEDVQ